RQLVPGFSVQEFGVRDSRSGFSHCARRRRTRAVRTIRTRSPNPERRTPNPFQYITPVRRGVHLFVDLDDAAVRIDVKRPPRSVAAGRKHAVRPRLFFRRIAKYRISHLERWGEPPIRVFRVDARGKNSKAALSQFVAARTERPALGRSAAGKRLRKPRER